MAKTLIIKGADFQANSLGKVSFDVVPCTGITLDKATDEILKIGNTSTLIAAVAPIDTTDIITWTSSDESVATVSNGVVTSVGVGVVTITATCGNYSASCVITSRAFISDYAVRVPQMYIYGDTASAGGNGLAAMDNNTGRGGLVSDTGELSLYGNFNNTVYYPIVMPINTGRIKINYNGAEIRGDAAMWFNSETSATEYNTVMKLIGKTLDAFAPSSGSDSVIVNIPSYDGYPSINAIAFCVRTRYYDEMTATELAKIDVEFLPAE